MSTAITCSKIQVKPTYMSQISFTIHQYILTGSQSVLCNSHQASNKRQDLNVLLIPVVYGKEKIMSYQTRTDVHNILRY